VKKGRGDGVEIGLLKGLIGHFIILFDFFYKIKLKINKILIRSQYN
jgi:hypothetical protein